MKILLLLFITLIGIPTAYAQHDHDHGDHAGHSHAGDIPTEATVEGYLKNEAFNKDYEMVLKYLPFTLKDTAVFRLYVSDFNNNIPVFDSKLFVLCPQVPSLSPKATLIDTGIYEIKVLFPKEGEYALKVHFNNTSMEIGMIEVHQELAAADEHDHEHEHHWYTNIFFVFGMGLLMGLLLMFFLKKPKHYTTILIVFFLAYQPLGQFTVQAGDAHNHDAPASKSSKNASLEFEIPKETQFLFAIRTQLVEQTNFRPATKLFGTVLAAPSGHAEILAPQYGKIKSINVQIGQTVQAGQTLAVLEQSTTTTDNVNISAQVGNLKMELTTAQKRLEAANKEVARLKTIEDIIAAKDLQYAQAAQQQAQAEVTRLQGLLDNDLDQAQNKTLLIKAPIAGTINNFSLAQGSQVSIGQTLFVIENAQKVVVEIQLNEQNIKQLYNAAFVQVSPVDNPNQITTAKLAYIVPSINAYNQTQKGMLEIDNKDLSFKIGQFVNVQVFEQNTQQALTIPNTAMSLLEGLPVVFIKKSPEVFVLRYVNPTQDNGQFVSLHKGITQGERVIVQNTYQAKMVFLNR